MVLRLDCNYLKVYIFFACSPICKWCKRSFFRARWGKKAGKQLHANGFYHLPKNTALSLSVLPHYLHLSGRLNLKNMKIWWSQNFFIYILRTWTWKRPLFKCRFHSKLDYCLPYMFLHNCGKRRHNLIKKHPRVTWKCWILNFKIVIFILIVFLLEQKGFFHRLSCWNVLKFLSRKAIDSNPFKTSIRMF